LGSGSLGGWGLGSLSLGNGAGSGAGRWSGLLSQLIGGRSGGSGSCGRSPMGGNLVPGCCGGTVGRLGRVLGTLIAGGTRLGRWFELIGGRMAGRSNGGSTFGRLPTLPPNPGKVLGRSIFGGFGGVLGGAGRVIGGVGRGGMGRACGGGVSVGGRTPIDGRVTFGSCGGGVGVGRGWAGLGGRDGVGRLGRGAGRWGAGSVCTLS
jgi:hypothetical protein